jgi:glycogen synthase
MHIAVLTKEYPPHVYGGAGVHVDHLTRQLAVAEDGRHRVDVLCIGDQDHRANNLRVTGIQGEYAFPARDPRHRKVFAPLFKNLLMAGALDPPDIVHSHTWYTNFAGCLIKELFEIPLVLTTHSLEPNRPWKSRQLGTGYNVSAWVERSAFELSDGVIAVSGAMKQDVLDAFGIDPGKIGVIHNGVDTDECRPVENADVLRRYGIDPRMDYILFVGRITPQKGILHLLEAARYLDSGTQIVLCAAQADTEDMEDEVRRRVQDLQDTGRLRVVWISDPVPRSAIAAIYSHAAAFVCPSVYEPFGIINLEAMACGTPVVASAVGGIPEIVEPGVTGHLVPFESASSRTPEPADPDRFARDLAAATNGLLRDRSERERMGRNGLERVRNHFTWTAVAERTLEFYRSLLPG